MISSFSWQRLIGIIAKEFRQMTRDSVTFIMIIGIPLLQLILFGYAINNNPKQLPTAVVSADQSIFTRSIIIALQNSTYFNILKPLNRETAEELLRRGKVQFIIYFPQHFSTRFVRGEKPELLIEADATDPAANSFSLTIFEHINQIITHQLPQSLHYLVPADPPIKLIIQAKYNPERISQYNIVPGLLGIVLTMTMVIVTSLAITREREKGTMESLLAMPVKPLEVMLGKIIPYILVGYIQASIILTLAHFIFAVPMNGNLLLLFIACFPFIIANLVVGLIFSSIAKNQLQAVQASFFFFLPSMLLSGFMFPFHGMPNWAQFIGSLLPLTHFLLIVRGIMLKGNSILEIYPDILAILTFFLVVLIIGVKRFRKTLD